MLLILALPVLLFGEFIAQRIEWVRHSNIPPPIIGGLIVSGTLLLVANVAPGAISLEGSTSNPFWLWTVLPQWDFSIPRATDVERPLLILFFTCIGLNASWRIVKKGGLPLVTYLGLAAAIAVIQAATGAAMAVALGESPLLGTMASNVSLMGGFGTAAGFAPEFEKCGLAGAATIGIAAAAFGVIAGGLIAGIVGGALVERKLGRKSVHRGRTETADDATPIGSTFIEDVRDLMRTRASTFLHLAVLVVCMKLGAFVSTFIQSAGITFPVYMGSMMVAAVVRNLHDAANRTWIKTDRTDGIGSVALMWLLAVVMIDLQLMQLAHSALPLLVILTVQVLIMAGLSYWMVFRVMGRDYEAAMMSAGMIGFGLGAVSNALATMRVLARRFGPAPTAFLIVPIVGVFLIDFINALLTTTALNFFK
ncbi:MAG: sodium/glutamate symporter [Opitutaceae bacterium]